MNAPNIPYINNADRLDKTKKLKDKTSENIHHILAKSLGGSDVKDNKIKLYWYIHNALHCLFGNVDILGKIDRIVDIEQTALDEDFLIDIEKLVKKRKGKDIYKDNIYRENV